MKIKYIGWLGQNNLGDEICFESIRKMLKESGYKYRKEIEIESGMCSGMSGDENALIIGGGTLLRLASDSRTSIMKFAIQHDIPVYFFGTGVIDIPYETVDKITPEVLDVMNKSASVCVRGPQSRRNLANNGFFGSKIISDPGLTISDEFFNNSNSNKVGINIGSTCHNLFGSEKYVMLAIEKIIDYLSKRGFEVILFPMWDKDFEILKQIPKTNKFSVVNWSHEISDLVGLMSQFRFIIGMKLHSIITAACLGIPYASLSYRNKCIDFSEGMNLERYCVKTDEPCLSDKIIEKIISIESGYNQIRANMSHWKERYKKHQESLADKIVGGE